jgi:hypothetical protein
VSWMPGCLYAWKPGSLGGLEDLHAWRPWKPGCLVALDAWRPPDSFNILSDTKFDKTFYVVS